MFETLVSEHNQDPLPILSAALVSHVSSLLDEQIIEIIDLSSTGQSLSQIIAYLRTKNPENTLIRSDITDLTHT